MTKAQYKAVKDFCEDNGCTVKELLGVLKENGSIDRNTTTKDLGEYAGGSNYESMLKFLEANVL